MFLNRSDSALSNLSWRSILNQLVLQSRYTRENKKTSLKS